MKKILAMLLAMAMVLSFAACGASDETAEKSSLTKLKVAYMPNWGSLWALATAENKGYFEEEGLDLELIQVEEGPTEVAALESKGIHVAYIGPGPHKLCSTGAAQVFLLQHIGQADFIIGLNGVQELQDLKGKKVGYAPGTASESLLANALSSVGLTMEDIDAVSLDAASLTASAVSGDLDAISCWNPHAETILAENKNAVKLGGNKDFPSVFAPGSWVVDPKWAEENKDILISFVRAMYRAMDYAAAAGYENELADEIAGYVASIVKTEPENVRDQRFDGSWLTSDQILVGMENGQILKYYGDQQQAFIDSGVLSEEDILSPEEFVLTDVMIEAGK